MRTRLPGDVHAPAAARRFVTDGLQDALTPAQPELSDDVTLIVSELVTNSVRASARTVDVHLRVADDRVEVEVTDDAAGWPTRQDARAEDVSGRGLEIVEQLADAWHTVPRATGKSVIATRFRQ